MMEVHLVQWLSSEDLELETLDQILYEADCVSLCTDALKKGINLFLLLSAMYK